MAWKSVLVYPTVYPPQFFLKTVIDFGVKRIRAGLNYVFSFFEILFSVWCVCW